MYAVTELPALPLDTGTTLAPALLAWCRYGRPAADARHVYLLLHGISASPFAVAHADAVPAPDAGWFQGWAGHGHPFIDLDRDCLLVPNAPGSCFGSSSPVGLPSPEDFPPLSIADTVRCYERWLARMGVTSLRAVIGYSYGGYQAFQCAVSPGFPARAVVVLASSPVGNGTQDDVQALQTLACRVHAGDSLAIQAWCRHRLATLQRYGYADWLEDNGVGNPQAALASQASEWAGFFSPWSMAALRQAATRFNVQRQLVTRTQGPSVLWMVNCADALFPSTDSLPLSADGVQRVVVQGRYGHLSPLLEPALWLPRVRAFLDQEAPVP